MKVSEFLHNDLPVFLLGAFYGKYVFRLSQRRYIQHRCIVRTIKKRLCTTTK